MCVVNTPIARSKVAETVARMDLDATTAEQRAETTFGVVVYAGRFEVSGDEVRHTLFTALNPNRVGDTQVRRITLSDDDLTLTAPPGQSGQSLPHPLAARREGVEFRHSLNGAWSPFRPDKRQPDVLEMPNDSADHRFAASGRNGVQGGDH